MERIKKRVVILSSNDWEGLYVDGVLVSEGHHLGEGDSLFLLKTAEKYNFKSNDVVSSYMNEQDIETTEDDGSFPSDISELTGVYDHE